MSRQFARTTAATLFVGLVTCSPAAGLAASRVSTQALRLAPSTTTRSMPRIAPDGDGGLYLAWLDGNGSSLAVFAQHFTRNGSIAPGWPAAGARLSYTGLTDNMSIVADGARGAFIAWDAADLYGSVALSHVGPQGAGTALWTGVAGAAVRPGGASASSARPVEPQKHDVGDAYPDMTPDGAGGVFFAWQHSSQMYGTVVQVQRFDANVHPVWSWNLTVSSQYPGGYYPKLSSDGSGGALVAWTEGYGTTAVKLMRVMPGGQLADGWPANGVRACDGAYTQAAPGIVPDAAGGALVAWADSRSASHDQVFAQHVASDATRGCSAEGSSVCSRPVDFGPNRYGWYAGADDRLGAIAADGQGGVLSTWVDHRGIDADVYAQRLDVTGAPASGWPVDGAVVCAFPGDQLLPALTSDQHGGAIVAWQDVSTGGIATLRWLKLDASGGLATDLPADGVVISATPDPAWPPSVCTDGAAGAFVAWVDLGGPVPDVMASHLMPDQVLAVPGANRGLLALASANPVRGAFVASFSLASSEPARLDVLDVGGRLVSRREVGALGPGAHTVAATAVPLPAGVYLMRVTQGSQSLSRRVVVIP